MDVMLALCFTLIAGVINGSYAFPTKYVKRWPFENTWMVFALYTFIVTPWLFLLSLNLNAIQVYLHAPHPLLWALLVGGVLFGCGQIGFAFAIGRIGMGLAFVINIGVSTALGSILPYVMMHGHREVHESTVVTLIGVLVIVAGLALSYFAGKRRDQHLPHLQVQAGRYLLGVVAAFIAGLGSAGQNYTFATTAPMQHLAANYGLSPLASSFVIWPGFLLCSALPYVIHMLVLNVKNKTFGAYLTAERRYYLIAILMAVFWFGSLVFYSKASQLIGHLGPVVIWPLFMSLIILTSNFWGWKVGEWQHADRRSKQLAVSGICLFIVAVMLFAFAAYLAQLAL